MAHEFIAEMHELSGQRNAQNMSVTKFAFLFEEFAEKWSTAAQSPLIERHKIIILCKLLIDMHYQNSNDEAYVCAAVRGRRCRKKNEEPLVVF